MSTCLASFLLLGCSTAPDNQRPPNFIIIMSDDQGWGDLSLTGNTSLSTPNIDRLAAEGAFLSRFYVSPVCSPTRAELLTGRYHPRGGVFSTSQGGERLDLDETTIAQVLQENGYRTGAIGKWHNGSQYPYHPLSRGFDEFYGFTSGHWGHYFDAFMDRNGEVVRGKGFIIDDLTNEAMSFVERHQETPFFLYLPLNTPHSPMQVPDEWWDKFVGKELGADHRYREREDTVHTKAAYAMCENIDWNVGRLMQKLEELDLSEETVVMYLSDNGPNGWRWIDGLEGRKGSTDEGGVRSPFVIRWPERISAGQTIDHVAGAIDLLPTVLDMAGIEERPAKALDGLSLEGLLTSSRQPPSRYIFSHWRDRVSLRNRQFLLDHEDQLFDLELDPGQTKNISTQFPEMFAEMQQAKEDWKREVLSELDLEEERPFPIGPSAGRPIWLPVRDAFAHGNITRSNRWPNSSFFQNWTSVDDSITWDIQVLVPGTYQVELYYTCAAADLGASVSLKFGGESVDAVINEAFDQSLIGEAEDRSPRIESYVQNFGKMSMGTIRVEEGRGLLSLKASEIPGSEVAQPWMITLRREN